MGSFLQDLAKLNRDPSRIIYVSGHALETSLQPENCVPIKPWKLENDDTALLDLIPFLECKRRAITRLCYSHSTSYKLKRNVRTYSFLV